MVVLLTFSKCDTTWAIQGFQLGGLSDAKNGDFEDATSRTLRRLRASMSWQKSPEKNWVWVNTYRYHF
jgi:hypothetical protein